MNLFTSLMRTLVPIAAGLVLSLATRVGLDLDDGLVTTYLTAGLTASYYTAFRGLESLGERLGWEPLRALAGVLLGWARPPQYEPEATVPLRVKLDFQYDAARLSDDVRRVVERGGGTLR